MQIVNRGVGEILKHNESATVLCRYKEINLLTDSLQSSNLDMAFASLVDKMTVRRYYSTYSASFDSGSSLMHAYTIVHQFLTAGLFLWHILSLEDWLMIAII